MFGEALHLTKDVNQNSFNSTLPIFPFYSCSLMCLFTVGLEIKGFRAYGLIQCLKFLWVLA